MLFRLALASALIALPVSVSAKFVPPPDVDASVDEARRYFTEDPDAPMVAPKGYDVTIVEYLDYNCPACKATHEPLRKLLAKDKKVRLIFRDWPIFGPGSEKAASLALAAKYQGKYLPFHDALMTGSGPLNEARIKAAAAKAGVNWAQLMKDSKTHSAEIEELLERNALQADMLGLEGTPGFLIGNTQIFGKLTLEQLEESVKEAREKAAAAPAS